MLLHVILAREAFATFWAERILLPRVLFRMASGVTRGGEVLAAVVLFGQGAGIGVFLGWTLAGRRHRCRE